MNQSSQDLPASEPCTDCATCPRLKQFRDEQRILEHSWHNAPVPSFGSRSAPLLIVGLAPGLKGANRTGRPFTGDYAGDLLYSTLLQLDLAAGTYAARSDDGLELMGCRISNAVRCVPPQNKPTPAEIRNCRVFLKASIAEMPSLRCIFALGRIAHESTLASLGLRASAFKFAHGARHILRDGLTLVDSYHCSRYNTNTGVLTADMFRQALECARAEAGLTTDADLR